MSRKPSAIDTTRCWMGNEYHVNGTVAGEVTQDGEFWRWKCKRYNGVGLSHSRERAMGWVEHYTDKMGAQ